MSHPENTHPLKLARKARQMTLTQLAELVHVDTGNLSRIERFQQKPSTEIAARIAGVFAGEITEMHLLYPERYLVNPKESLHVKKSALDHCAS